MSLVIEDINQRNPADFVELLGSIFEHSPWVAERVYSQRPFDSRDSLHRQMAAIVRQSTDIERMELLCAHPELAGKEADAGTLTSESKREQGGAGLDQCTSEELGKIQRLNLAYRERFGFPFIIAVTGLDKYQIIAAMDTRLENDARREFDNALGEVEKIARIRIDALIDE